jgi:CBS domain-containing protein
MKVRDVMSANPVCCVPEDTAQKVAQIMCDHNIGSVPVILDQESRELLGMITDRDLCCSVIAAGLDSRTTQIKEFVGVHFVVTCRDGENVDKCEKAMQEHQVRRIPVVDGDNRVIGIVAQADVALKDKPDRVSQTVKAISDNKRSSIAA